MRLPIEQVLVDIIQKEMTLDVKNVFIRDQTILISGDDKLRVTVGLSDAPTIMANNTHMESYIIPNSDPITYQQTEVNCVQLRENMQVDIFSRSNAAILRRWEILAAVGSFYSKQTQEKENFKIARISSSFVNTSSAEGGSMLNRFSLIIPCLVWYKKVKSLAPNGGMYYDDFSTRVDDAQTIGKPDGLIEFNIKGENIT